MSSQSFKLYYFPLRNLAEAARQIFALAGVEYEDIRVTPEEWPTYKKDMPFGQMPVLEDNGYKIPQSLACTRYLARRFGYSGKNPLEAATVDALAELYKDFYSAASGFFYTKVGIKKLDLTEEEPKMLAARDNFLAIVTTFLKKSQSGFLVDGGLTYADLFIVDSLTTYLAWIPDFLEQYPEVAAYREKVINVPALKEHLKKRPVTDI